MTYIYGNGLSSVYDMVAEIKDQLDEEMAKPIGERDKEKIFNLQYRLMMTGSQIPYIPRTR